MKTATNNDNKLLDSLCQSVGLIPEWIKSFKPLHNETKKSYQAEIFGSKYFIKFGEDNAIVSMVLISKSK